MALKLEWLNIRGPLLGYGRVNSSALATDMQHVRTVGSGVSVQSVPRLHNESQLSLRDSLETAVREAVPSTERTVKLRRPSSKLQFPKRVGRLSTFFRYF